MIIGHTVKVKATGETGTVKGFADHGRAFELSARVEFPDGDVCPYALSELEVIMQPSLWVRYTREWERTCGYGIYRIDSIFPMGNITVIRTGTRWRDASWLEIVPELIPVAGDITAHAYRYGNRNTPLYANFAGETDAATARLMAMERNYKQQRENRANRPF